MSISCRPTAPACPAGNVSHEQLFRDCQTEFVSDTALQLGIPHKLGDNNSSVLESPLQKFLSVVTPPWHTDPPGYDAILGIALGCHFQPLCRDLLGIACSAEEGIEERGRALAAAEHLLQAPVDCSGFLEAAGPHRFRSLLDLSREATLGTLLPVDELAAPRFKRWMACFGLPRAPDPQAPELAAGLKRLAERVLVKLRTQSPEPYNKAVHASHVDLRSRDQLM